MKILIIGGSGFVSGTVARMALARGHDVWTVTRGERALPDGVHGIIADRKDSEAFENGITSAGVHWDMAVDCIGFSGDDAKSDVRSVLPRTGHLVFVSTDFVYDPAHRVFPQGEASATYAPDGYGSAKRMAELVFAGEGSSVGSSVGTEDWTVLRPCHIYGPGSELGCLPHHSRDKELITRIDRGESLTLVGGGHFLQEPLFVEDLADVILSVGAANGAKGKILNVSGPDCIESRDYYRVIGRCRGKDVAFTEVPVDKSLAEHPEWKPFLCHRFYDKRGLSSLVDPPSTGIENGIQAHVNWLLGR